MRRYLSPWEGLWTGLVFTLCALLALTGEEDEGIYWHYDIGFIPNWIGWFILPMALAITIVSIRTIWRNRGKPKKTTVTDEELAQSEADLDYLYFRQYGEMPKKPPKTEETEENPPPGGTEDRPIIS